MPRWRLKYSEYDPVYAEAPYYEPRLINRQLLEWAPSEGNSAHNMFEVLETHLDSTGVSGQVELWFETPGQRNTKQRRYIRGMDMPQPGRGRKVSRSGKRIL